MVSEKSSTAEKRYYSPEEILKFKPYTEGMDSNVGSALEHAEARVRGAGVWHDRQILGRRYPIGCVALEVTQRCNLDCTLCYLSENSESVKDIPIEEVFRRIDLIKDHYGPGTDVQITGGDPTLRDTEELVQIVKRVKMLGMNPTLMTNGLKATRPLLERLIAVGLKDVAFHVDLTQERRPFKTEMELNKVRKIYIERVRGLPIHIIFNTTVFKDNFHEIPDLIRFFREHSDIVQFASFQLQADTGRGELRKRDNVISMETVWEQIEKGAEVKLPFEAIQIGHGDCNRYSVSLTANGKMFPLLDSPEFIQDFMHASEGLVLDRTNKWSFARNLGGWMMKNPKLARKGVMSVVVPKVMKMSKHLLASKGKMGKLTFFVHNFMDASQLECDRVDSCSFMAMTTEGPISMCMHNAKRDEFILKPFQVKHGNDKKIWNPL
ncbi:MAG: radical SAM protein, partial [Bdellovibrionales bacterium]|nr:radical SAM protein [Oligoflexia bacterium]